MTSRVLAWHKSRTQRWYRRAFLCANTTCRIRAAGEAKTEHDGVSRSCGCCRATDITGHTFLYAEAHGRNSRRFISQHNNLVCTESARPDQQTKCFTQLGVVLSAQTCSWMCGASSVPTGSVPSGFPCLANLHQAKHMQEMLPPLPPSTGTKTDALSLPLNDPMSLTKLRRAGPNPQSTVHAQLSGPVSLVTPIRSSLLPSLARGSHGRSHPRGVRRASTGWECSQPQWGRVDGQLGTVWWCGVMAGQLWLVNPFTPTPHVNPFNLHSSGYNHCMTTGYIYHDICIITLSILL